MIHKSKDLKHPAWNATVWRYMGLDKFLCLITEQKIALCRLDLLSDKNESNIPLDENFTNNSKYFHNIENKSSIEILQKLEDIWKRSFVSSWSIQPSESFALWKIYLNGNNPGVAIKSNYKDLIESINPNKLDVSIGKVNYFDNNTDRIFYFLKSHSNARAICGKLRPYEYESELRIFCTLNNFDIRTDDGTINLGRPQSLLCDVNLDQMIHEIYLSPWSRGWFRTSFIKLMRSINPKMASRIKLSTIEDG